ncbi:hypothetical protein C8J57DRAFT_1227076 [Mycena rebaudengoi]|nr:hypothetical protein C8J57DRAFT_1227076 [Mycena rebaudengoi]
MWGSAVPSPSATTTMRRHSNGEPTIARSKGSKLKHIHEGISRRMVWMWLEGFTVGRQKRFWTGASHSSMRRWVNAGNEFSSRTESPEPGSLQKEQHLRGHRQSLVVKAQARDIGARGRAKAIPYREWHKVGISNEIEGIKSGATDTNGGETNDSFEQLQYLSWQRLPVVPVECRYIGSSGIENEKQSDWIPVRMSGGIWGMCGGTPPKCPHIDSRCSHHMVPIFFDTWSQLSASWLAKIILIFKSNLNAHSRVALCCDNRTGVAPSTGREKNESQKDN